MDPREIPLQETFDVLNNLGHRTLDCTEVPEVALARATGDSGGGDDSPSLISSMLLLQVFNA